MGGAIEAPVLHTPIMTAAEMMLCVCIAGLLFTSIAHEFFQNVVNLTPRKHWVMTFYDGVDNILGVQ